MPSRRPHPKSRSGCSQCKKRRVRCDQQTPTCGHCARREEVCSFSESVQATPALVESPPTTPEHLLDLELMHHFTSSTYLTLSENPAYRHAWQVIVPREALHHTYLLHCLLALSALHLLSTSPGPKSDSYRAAAVRYHDSSVITFQRLLGNITTENCHALYTSSLLIAFFAATAPSLLPGTEPTSPIDDIISLCELATGTRLVVQSSMYTLRSGPMGALVSPTQWNGNGRITLPTDVLEALRALIIPVEVLDEKDPDRPVYLRAIDTIAENYKAILFNPDLPLMIFMWLAVVPRPFVDLLKSGDSLAVTILAHYTVILHMRKEMWYSGTRGYDLLKHIHGTIDPGWRPLLRWPMRQVGLPIHEISAPSSTCNAITPPDSDQGKRDVRDSATQILDSMLDGTLFPFDGLSWS